MPTPSFDPSAFPGYEALLASRARSEAGCAEYEAANPPASYGYAAERVAVATRDGAEIQLKVSRPLPDSVGSSPPLRPLFFTTHGGGWREGAAAYEEMIELQALLSQLGAEWPASATSPDQNAGASTPQSSTAHRSVAADLRPVVFSVEYRLAPEHPYPVPVHDSIDALEWAVAHAMEWGADASRVILGGASAGGHLAAVLALETVGGGVKGLDAAALQALLLTVPMLCHWAHWPGGDEPESYARATPQMGSEFSRGLWNAFAGTQPAEGDWRVSPFLGSLEGLPKTTLFVAGKCPFADEGKAFNPKLQAAGVPSVLHVYDGASHVFLIEDGDPNIEPFRRDFLAAYKAAVL